MPRPKGSKNKPKPQPEAKVQELIEGIKPKEAMKSKWGDGWYFAQKYTNDPAQIILTLTRKFTKDKTLDDFIESAPKKLTILEVRDLIVGKDPLAILYSLYNQNVRPEEVFASIRENKVKVLQSIYDDLHTIILGRGAVDINGNRDMAMSLNLSVICSDGLAEFNITSSRSKLLAQSAPDSNV